MSAGTADKPAGAVERSGGGGREPSLNRRPSAASSASSRPSNSAPSFMTRGTLFWPPSLPRRFIQAAKKPGGATLTSGARKPKPPERWAA